MYGDEFRASEDHAGAASGQCRHHHRDAQHHLRENPEMGEGMDLAKQLQEQVEGLQKEQKRGETGHIRPRALNAQHRHKHNHGQGGGRHTQRRSREQALWR